MHPTPSWPAGQLADKGGLTDELKQTLKGVLSEFKEQFKATQVPA